ncbi:hypothetical protein ASG87_18050 [Frateuria sp. Soil773]|nr:hypothetical protein ASG87_18050 [Frateuria sp. Soil773]
MDCTTSVRQIDDFMIMLIHHNSDLVEKALNNRLMALPNSKSLYSTFMTCLRTDLAFVRKVFPQHRFSPYYELYEQRMGDRLKILALIHDADADGLNKVVATLRRAARADAFRKQIDKHERAARKNGNSVRRYIRALFDRYSRLRVIRLDLTYQRKYVETAYRLLKEDSAPPDPVTATEVAQHRDAFLEHIRKSYPSLVGYIWKIEHGVYKSFHMHWIIFLNGHEVMQDRTIAQAMGNHWATHITNERGSYWNVNAQKGNYERLGMLGIGEVNWDDEDKRRALERVALYLAKVDYFIRLKAPSLGRIFGKGVAPKYGHSRLGRPRSRSVSEHHTRRSNHRDVATSEQS